MVAFQAIDPGSTPGRRTEFFFFFIVVFHNYAMLTDLAFLPPANELREGNVFTPVCHSVHSGGVYPSIQWGLHPPKQMATEAGGTHPTGMHSCCV